MALVAVCQDPEVASVLMAQGAHLVLCGPDPSRLSGAIVGLRNAAPGGGRVAALIGDMADPEVQATAIAMANELFGGPAVAVPTVVDACQLMAAAPGRPGAGSGTV